ncbi:MAG: hypothetical protein KGO81_15360, partial [Bacteroidota bacterium]|nr:hypothetical protein [Bacteroidota bacterium]
MAVKKPYHSIAYKGIVFKYIIAFIIGLGVGFRYIPNPVMSGMYILLCAICLYFALRENLDKLFMVLPFVCYTEVYMRGYIKSMPYLMVEYLYLAMFGFLILKHLKDKKAHSHAYILMIVFALMELLNGLFPDDARLFKPIIINS